MDGTQIPMKMPVCRSTRNQQATEPKNDRKAATNQRMTGRLSFGMPGTIHAVVGGTTPLDRIDRAEVSGLE